MNHYGARVELMSMMILARSSRSWQALKGVPFCRAPAEEIGKDLWAYLEQACYSRKWQPGKTFLAFNISSPAKIWDSSAQSEQSARLGGLSGRDRRMNPYNAKWTLIVPFSSLRDRPIGYSPSSMRISSFATEEERVVKRFVRDRVQYVTLCTAQVARSSKR